MGNEVKDQQVGCLWTGKHLISVGLSGQIAFLDRDGQSASRIIRVNMQYVNWFTNIVDCRFS